MIKIMIFALFIGFLSFFPLSDQAEELIEKKTVKQTGKQNSFIDFTKTVLLPEIRTIGSTHTFTLANGLQVLVFPHHRAPIVTQMIWYRAGSADEPKGRTGIAHFLEHLMFKGTEKYPDGEFSRFVSQIGGEENAFTSRDYTCYYQSVSSDYLEDIMLRESDRMKNLSLNNQVVDLERKVIIEERRMRIDNNPKAVLAEEARATLYLNSPYRNPVIGWKQEMEKLTREDALAFYNRFYTPDNAVVIIAGDVIPEKVRELSMSTYGRVDHLSRIPERVRPQEPKSHTFREVIKRDPRVTQEAYQQYWIVPSYHNAKPGEAEALDLLCEILGKANYSRLDRKLVVDRKIATSVSSSYQGDALDSGVFYVYGMPRDKAKLEEIRLAINAEISDIIENGLEEIELERACNHFIKTMILSLDDPVGLALLYGAALSTGQTIEDITKWKDRIKAIKPIDIRIVAERYLIPDRGIISRLLPSDDRDGQNILRSKEKN